MKRIATILALIGTFSSFVYASEKVCFNKEALEVGDKTLNSIDFKMYSIKSKLSEGYFVIQDENEKTSTVTCENLTYTHFAVDTYSEKDVRFHRLANGDMVYTQDGKIGELVAYEESVTPDDHVINLYYVKYDNNEIKVWTAKDYITRVKE